MCYTTYFCKIIAYLLAYIKNPLYIALYLKTIINQNLAL